MINKTYCLGFYVLLTVFGVVHAQESYMELTPQGINYSVNTPGNGVSSEPRLAMNAAGKIIYVWEQDTLNGNRDDVWFCVTDSTGIKQVEPRLLNTTVALDQREPDVAVIPDGTAFVVVWESYNQAGGASGLDIVMRLYNISGTAESNEIIVNLTTDSQQKNPRIATNQQNGDVYVVWQSLVGEVYKVYFRRFSFTLTPLSDEILVAEAAVDQVFPAIAILPNGQFAVTWEEGTSTDRSVLYRRYSGDAQPIDTTNQKTGLICCPGFHDVSAGKNNEWVIVSADKDRKISSWYIEEPTDNITTGVIPGINGICPRVQMGTNSQFAVSWIDPAKDIYGKYIIKDGRTSNITQPADTATISNGITCITGNTDLGVFCQVWEGNANAASLGDLFAQLYKPAVPESPGAFPPQTPVSYWMVY